MPLCTTHNRPGIKKCDICQELFKDGEQFMVKEVQNSVFRGEDDVFAFHKQCLNSRRSSPSTR